MTTIHTRQLQQYTQDNYNNTPKTNTTIHPRQIQQYTQDNYNNTHKKTTTIHTRQLTTIHTRHLKVQHVQKVNNTTVRKYCIYLLSPCCRVLLEKLTGLQLVKKFPAFHGTRRFITALTSVRHLSLSWASPIQSIYPHPTCWRSNLILYTHLCQCLPIVLLPSGFPTKTLYSFYYFPHTHSTHTFTPTLHFSPLYCSYKLFP